MNYYDYSVPCQEGGITACDNEVVVSIPIDDLTEEQINELVERGVTYITKAQVEESAYPVTKDKLEEMERIGEMAFSYPLGSICCAECGSDQN